MSFKNMTCLLAIAGLGIAACGPQYAKDPNANVLVTSQYEDGPVKIITNEKNCKSQVDCKNKTEAECAAALYNSSLSMIEQASEFTEKELYLSARLEYMHALCRLYEAEIRIKRAKTTNYTDFKVISTLKLDKLVAKSIAYCEKMRLKLQWK